MIDNKLWKSFFRTKFLYKLSNLGMFIRIFRVIVQAKKAF